MKLYNTLKDLIVEVASIDAIVDSIKKKRRVIVYYDGDELYGHLDLQRDFRQWRGGFFAPLRGGLRQRRPAQELLRWRYNGLELSRRQRGQRRYRKDRQRPACSRWIKLSFWPVLELGQLGPDVIYRGNWNSSAVLAL